ncbi:P-loop NTPase fold protein [Streptomyces cyaneofuscatus]|uniref:ATP-binding protein n=1 Tax=Streptomyces cyaneofuscatus TaxID=66883 RepID=UPI0036C8F683
MRAAMSTDSNINRAIEPNKGLLLAFRKATLRRRIIESSRHSRQASTEWDWKSLGALIVPALFALSRLADVHQIATITWAAGAALWVMIALSDRTARRTLTQWSASMSLLPLDFYFSVKAELKGKAWQKELQKTGVKPLLRLVWQAFLGDDPEELLIPESYDGLRSSTGRRYLVRSDVAERLDHKIQQMDGGVTAICGPRGAGKSTLLTSAPKDGDFVVLVSAPASFTPHDFLKSLFVKLCEIYISSEGGEVPRFVRLTTTRRALRNLIPRVSRTATWLFYAGISGSLISLGSFATIRSVEEQYGNSTYHKIQGFTEDAAELAADIWKGQNLGAGLFVILLGIAAWRARRKSVVARGLRRAYTAAVRLTGAALALIPVISLSSDDEIEKKIGAVFEDELTFFIGLALLFLYLFANQEDGGAWTWRSIRVPKQHARTALRLAVLSAVAWGVYKSPEIRTLAADPGTSMAVISILLGFTLLNVAEWKMEPSEAPLVTKCKDHLFRLQTLQNTSTAVTTGASQLFSLGSSHTVAVSTLPPNYPDLVSDFREVLEEVALTRRFLRARTFICIDEIDRLGTDEQALSFLREIKAIFGIPYVHYLISVAEDVGSSFVRRGITHRDVTDSSLDDVIYLRPSTLPMTQRILQKRAPGISAPYVALIHALSGGLPRDIVRYGRRVMEVEKSAASAELAEISRQLILEELSETLSGFRVLLSKYQWREDDSVILDAFRNVMTLLSFSQTPGSEVRQALRTFAEARSILSPPSGNSQMPEDISHIVAEASACAYFSLTLWDIFGSEGFTRRSEVAANHGPEGTPQLLAEARQELGVSPYTTRRLLGSIRQAWGLDALRPAGMTLPTMRHPSAPA